MKVLCNRCPACSGPPARRPRRSGHPEGVAVPLDPLDPASLWKCLACGAELGGDEAAKIAAAFDVNGGAHINRLQRLFYCVYGSVVADSV